MKECNSKATPPRYGFDFSEEKYAAFLELVEKTCFLHQVDGFTEDEKLWHFHPIAFVQHLKRLFDDVLVTADQLKQIMPNVTDTRINIFLKPLNDTMQEFDITTRKRKAHFLAQIGHETHDLIYGRNCKR